MQQHVIKSPSGATESNRSQFRRVLIENGLESMATIDMNAQSRSPRGGFLLVLIWENLGPKLPQALLGHRDAD